MADIFISYAREDKDKARILADALEEHGWSVWWDPHIPAGREFDDAIEDALNAAKCVVVLWSSRSIKSRWVKTEAGEGVERGILVPALIEDVKPPLAFRRIQAADLSGWSGDSQNEATTRLFRSILVFAGPPSKSPTSAIQSLNTPATLPNPSVAAKKIRDERAVLDGDGKKCPDCNGFGMIQDPSVDPSKFFLPLIPCPTCTGHRKVRK